MTISRMPPSGPPSSPVARVGEIAAPEGPAAGATPEAVEPASTSAAIVPAAKAPPPTLSAQDIERLAAVVDNMPAQELAARYKPLVEAARRSGKLVPASKGAGIRQ